MTIRRIRMVVLAGLMLLAVPGVTFPAGAVRAAQDSGQMQAAVASIKISFKMDSSVTRGMYMGDRWISPPTFYLSAEGSQVTVDAVARALDARGQAVDLIPVWEASDPSMIAVVPVSGPYVKLKILKAGKSNLKVTSGGISRLLPVKVWHKSDELQVEITQ